MTRPPCDPRRPNVFEIDLDATAANVVEVRRFVGPDMQTCVALKANAYGFGLLEVAPVLQESGAEWSLWPTCQTRYSSEADKEDDRQVILK